MKKVQYFIDDVIWVFRDLTRKNPKSIYDNDFLKTLKKAHDEYGLKVQLNCFYRTSFWYGNDEFSLSDMTDKYKAEFTEASNWLKFGFHSIEEWPDYPYVNADYEQVDENYNRIKKEIVRFAGENSFAKSVLPHWVPMSKEGVKALYDNGVRLMLATFGDKKEWDGKQDSLPYGHSFRLIHNRKPETGVFTRKGRDVAIANSICGHNNLTEKQHNEIFGTTKTVLDQETGMRFVSVGDYLLNLSTIDKIENDMKKYVGMEYLPIGNHEQYFYKDYYAYQPDYADKIMASAKIFARYGFEFIFAEDLIK